MNLARVIDRRERIADHIGTAAIIILVAMFIEFVWACMSLSRHGLSNLVTIIIVMGCTFALLPMLFLVAKFNRRHDALILMEIKRRLERPLLELFKLEYAGQTVSFEDYFAWREEYFRRAEDTVTPPIDLWLGAVKRAELPGAHAYRRRFDKEAIYVDTAMSLILADN